MKRIIDIDEELAEKGHWYTDEEIWTVIKAAQNGIPIPDNATNGNSVIKMFFKGIVRISSRKNVSVEFNKDWWNAPYQKGNKE